MQTWRAVQDILFAASKNYWLTRFILLRFLGAIYAIAFLVAAQQNAALLGEHGLLPAPLYLDRVATVLGSRTAAFLRFPSFFWFGFSDSLLNAAAWGGFALSLVVVLGWANIPIMAALWATYMSIVHIGQDWYSYGWEIQLLETGFLGIFLCPLLDPRPFPDRAPPVLMIWLFRWLGFRIMFGAGLIKLRGDPCWRDLTCLYYHYETQPIPNPLSRLFHFRPHWFHQAGAVWNHFVELVVPWFGFGPRLARHIAGGLLISFQIILIVSGNLSFLNWLTIVPFLACFDDSVLRRVLPRGLVAMADRARDSAPVSRHEFVASACVSVVIVYLSFAPVINLLSGQQVMNGSFDPLELVNTYGAFGSVVASVTRSSSKERAMLPSTRTPSGFRTNSRPSLAIRCGGRR